MKIIMLHFHVKEPLMSGFVLFSETNIKNLAVTLRTGRKASKEAHKMQHEGCFSTITTHSRLSSGDQKCLIQTGVRLKVEEGRLFMVMVETIPMN